MTLTVLAIDDSPTMRNMFSLALAHEDIVLHLAEDGAAGLDLLRRITPDVVISDINMPDLDGFGFIEAVRRQERFRTLPILVLTTEPGPELRARARAAGATGWIVKPFDAQKMIRTLRLVAGSGG
ncbi:response regulator [Paenirhodobacter populi]|uniref:Response regulator n=1 Tax=Paenirhodobacter populi TaxID=2306993 RepID=A0A443J289_9RHOB|nr:response regulator [Sinirhodobacter populi]RWR10724.1 response regulator [Sinirhodobacter populi]RWR14741.1 response regulator [Sinirhodobacter populi]RWR24056.1 response regulator [Sinirhodobacter populi]RWR32795.1 response regulator [Sinirhodobacter populi]RWR35261.1 response regulator [Sinirhodobacter populi]